MAAVEGDVLQTVAPGIFREEIGKVAILSKEAEIWIRLDLSPLEEEIQIIRNLAKKLTTLCETSSKYLDKFKLSCENVAKLAITMNENLVEDYNEIFPKRVKRQAIDIVNTGVKILFGAIEMFDRKNFDRKLKSMSEKHEAFNFELAQLVEKNIANISDNTEVITKIYSSRI